MKFSKKVEEIKNKEEYRGKIVLVRCGIFVVAIGNDAILLNKMFGLKLTCFKENVCKVGMPVSFVLKYLELIEEKGYGYVLYDYEKNTKNLIPKYNYNGITNTEERNCKECKNCERYVEHNPYDTVNLFEAIEQRKGMQAKDEQ